MPEDVIEPFSDFPGNPDIIDVVASIDDPKGAAAERVRRANPVYMLDYMNKKLFEALRVPPEFLRS